MKVADVMSSPAITVSPDTPIRQAAAIMRDRDVGVLPVLAGARVVGIVTDRDLVVLVLALRDDAGTQPVRQAMSPDPVFCQNTQSVKEAVALMGEAQIDRLLVADGQERLVGVISVGDIAVNASEVLAGQAIGEIREARRRRTRGHRIRPLE
ncbi:MAG: CBS domain-containing protein [Roseicyclus sp.]